MKKITIWLLLLSSVLLAAFPAFAISDEEQNAGYVDFTTAVYTVRPDAITYIYRTTPASTTTWVANHPNCQYVVLPKACRGFELAAFGADLIVNNPANISTGAVYVGTKVASGSVLRWDYLDLDQRTINFGVLSNSSGNATMTIYGW